MSLHAGSGSALAASSVTYAKLQNEAATTLLGNPTGSPAAPSEITLAGGLSFSGTTLSGPVEHPGYIVGNWYSTVPWAAISAGAAFSASAIRLLPFTISKPITVSALGARVTTLSAAGNFQLAIYANNATTGRPTGTALVSTGSISTGATGAVSAAVSANATLSPGTYWMAINQDNGVAVYQTLSAATNGGSYLIGSATLANITSGAAAVTLTLTVTQTFGTWPDLTSGSFTESSGLTNALVYMKAA